AELRRDRARDLAAPLEGLRDLQRHAAQLVVKTFAVGDVAFERVLDADGDPLGAPVLERPRVDPAGAVAEHRSDAPGEGAAERAAVRTASAMPRAARKSGATSPMSR